MSVFFTEDYGGDWVLKIPDDELKGIICEHLHLDPDDVDKEELDELVNEYIDHFDSQGWSLYPRLFEGSLSEWREEGK